MGERPRRSLDSQIFLHVETKFFVLLQKIFNENIDSKKNCLWSTKNPTVLCNYNKIRHQSAEKVYKLRNSNESIRTFNYVERPSQYIFIGQGYLWVA